MKTLVKNPKKSTAKFNDFQKVVIPKKSLSKLKGGDGDYIGVEDILIV